MQFRRLIGGNGASNGRTARRYLLSVKSDGSTCPQHWDAVVKIEGEAHDRDGHLHIEEGPAQGTQTAEQRGLRVRGDPVRLGGVIGELIVVAPRLLEVGDHVVHLARSGLVFRLAVVVA